MHRWRVGVGWAGWPLTVAGQWLIVGVARGGNRWSTLDGARALAVWLVGLTAVVVAAAPQGSPAPTCAGAPLGPRPSARWSLAGVGVALIAAGVLLLRGAEWNPAAAAACWSLALVALLVGAGTPPHGHWRWPSRPRPSVHGWWALAIVGLAGAIRVSALGSHPRIADGDGAGFALLAREVARGRLTDPFATGYLGHPTMFAFVQRAAMAVGGDTLAGARLASAVAGTAAVAVTYLLARRLAGASVALVAAAVLAVLPIHVHFSRLALNNVFDSLTLATALWLATRALDEHRRSDAVLAGMVLGLGQYFYFSARLVAVFVGVFALWRGTEAIRRGTGVARVASLWLWIAAGALIAFAPLALQYLEHPETFSPRDTQVLLIGDGVAARQARAVSSLGAVLVDSIGHALLSAFGRAGNSTYHPEPPTIGWVFAAPLAVGVALCAARARRSSSGVIALGWLAAFVAVGLTLDYPITRWVFATPLVAIAIAHGLVTAWRLLVASLAMFGLPPRSARMVRRAAAVVAAVAIAASGLTREFVGPPLQRYGDVNSLVATRLADELSREPSGTVVFGLMPPRMGLDSHHMTRLEAQHVTGVDVVEPLVRAADVPPISGPAVFVFLPERLAELDVVRGRLPGGTVSTRTAEGLELYTLYRVDAAAVSSSADE